MKFSRIIAASALVGLSLSLTACGNTVPETGSKTDVPGSGDVYTFTSADGLDCDVFDTVKGGGISCDHDAFTVPTTWKPGVIETIDVADGAASITFFKDEHYCVTFDGVKSGGITCAYPKQVTS